MGLSTEQKRRVTEHALQQLGKQAVHDSVLKKVVAAVVDAVDTEYRERLRTAKAKRRAEGRFLGGAKAPFGFRLGGDGKLRKCPQQQRWIRVIQKNSGQMSLRAIAAQIQADGFEISHTAVASILKAGTLSRLSS